MSVINTTLDEQTIATFVDDQIEAFGVDRDDINPDAGFEELGLDSLDLVELSQAAKKKLGINIKPKDFIGTVTVADAVAVINAKASGE